MTPKPTSPRGNLVDTLRSGTGSIRSALSQLATRRKQPETPPAPAAHKPAPEGPRWGQLVLLDKVGEGSFGEVYRAWDLILEREVALKLMLAAEEDPALLLEARMLARLRHPNVVTVFGVDRHDGRSGVWMDFIEGETLAALVEQRGSFGAQEALLVGVDVCRALAAAHQSGLLHRDIKAQNVMRERGGRIVLMDFGLGHETAGGEPTDLGGTPLYMAPEVLEGEPATVPSDLYAVGVLLFHLVTRAYPVEGSSLEELRAAHGAHRARSLRDLRPDLPSAFSRVVEKAIAPEPARRYATAGQMTSALEAAQGTRRLALPISRRAFWRIAPPLAVGGAAVTWYLKHQTGVAVKAGRSLLLSEIRNISGDQQFDAVADVLRAQLAESAHFNLLDADQVKETLRLMTKPEDQKLDLALAREVALRSQTPLVVYGTVSPLGTGYGLSLVMERVEGQPLTPVSTKSNLFEARNHGMFDAIHQAANWIRQKAGEATKDISANDTQPEEATTSSWEALDSFSRGERLREQDRSKEAVSMYKLAELKDSNFALALARIAQLQGTLLNPAESFSYWRKAVQALGARHVTRREDYRIRSLHADRTADCQRADVLTAAWVLYYPADWRAHHYRALALRNLEQFTEARKELVASQGLHPTPETLRNLIRVDLLLGDHRGAASYAKGLHDGYEKYDGAVAKVLEGDFKGAEIDLASVLSGGGDSRVLSKAAVAFAYLLAERGRQHEALAALDEGITRDAKDGHFPRKSRKLVAKAHLELLGGRFGSARDLALRAANEDPDTVNQALAGALLARAGFAAEARNLLARLNSPDEGRRFETARAMLTAETRLAEGHIPEALFSLEEANRLAPPIHPRAFWAYGLERAGRSGDALIAWRRIASAPALLWTEIHDDAYDPCLWTEALLKTARLELEAGRKTEARTALDQFFEIRKDPDPDDPLSAAARKLLNTF